MIARINTVAFHGVEVQNVDVQVQISSGLPAFTNVGYIIFLLFLSVLAFPAEKVGAQTIINDVSHLNETVVSEIRKPVSEQDIQQAVQDALIANKKISIAGKRHSQGGHIMTDDAIILDMTAFNKIIGLNSEKKTLKVQSGVTWAQIQDYLNAQGLAIKVQQSSNIFTVGGSLSVNIHGRDPRFGSIIDTVRSIRLVIADGKIVTASREENADLFSLAIGGYGLFGVITEAELEVTQNSVLKRVTSTMDCKEYPAYLQGKVLNNDNIELHYSRPDITERSFMDDCIVTSYERVTDNAADLHPLNQEKLIEGSKWLLDLSRKTDWGKRTRWFIQESYLDEMGAPEIISRNNAMRPPIKFLDYTSPQDTDVLQEYFIPIASAAAFMDDLEKIVQENKINVLSITLRLAKKDKASFLAYAPTDSLAFVLYINHGKDALSIEKTKVWSRELIDAAINHNGTYYLTYASYATPDRIRAAYPMLDDFFAKKDFYDPSSIFSNKFYELYRG